ncbi:hypothetical protein FRC04_001521 [Tulasnella sp. 424]|nr:hypothetical protein FRC04_001521 [Tulasnella sp. 424]KAG8969067.1 hypothetical protein FRC05_001220 [Tulasnella sp. 425]
MSRQLLAYDDLGEPNASPRPPYNNPKGGPPQQGAVTVDRAYLNGPDKPAPDGPQYTQPGGPRFTSKRKQKQRQQPAARSEQAHAGGNGDGEAARKRKKRRFEESLEHDRVHWDAQGQREYGALEVRYDDNAEDTDAPAVDPQSDVSGVGATTSARPQLGFEDALNSMFEDAERDISETETNGRQREGPSTAQQAKNKTEKTKKNVANQESVAVTSGATSANPSKPAGSWKKEDKGKAAEKPPVDTTALLMDSDAWDDSVLIDAWDAAMEEYQILNGPEADWKKDPVHKDSIWYKSSSGADLRWEDVKPAAPKNDLVGSSVRSAATAQAGTYDDENDHQMEDGAEEQGQAVAGPSASGTAGQELHSSNVLPATFDISKMSKDELFQKAVEASYWAGYWAAAYHASNNTPAEQET